ncbi:MAG: hypothetical protein U0176_05945 [Bacteroidia bacterium]
MRQAIVFIIAALLLGVAQARGHFLLRSEVGAIHVSVNGRTYLVDSNGVRIPTVFPRLDSLKFKDPGAQGSHSIACEFLPDSSYTIVPACCASLDLVPSWKARNPDLLLLYEEYEQNIELIIDKLLDHPKFEFRVNHASAKDSIYGWYVDYACFSSIRVIDEQGWRYGQAAKCFFWSNLSTFEFFQSHHDFSGDMDSLGTIVDVYPDDERKSLGYVTVRLFRDDWYVVEYDAKRERIRVFRRK